MIVCLKAISHSNQLDDCAMGNGWEKEGICERGQGGRPGSWDEGARESNGSYSCWSRNSGEW